MAARRTYSAQAIAENIGGALQIALLIPLSPLLRGWMRSWGAAPDEARRALPGDELTPHPQIRFTRAITIDAPPGAVWPWIVQQGQGRGGLYSYDALENLIGCDIHSTDRILPDMQNIQPGDAVRLGPEGYPCFYVREVVPERTLVLFSDPGTEPDATAPEPPALSSWVFHLEEQASGSTRLLVRGATQWEPSFAANLMWQLSDVLGFVMGRRQMRGIKARAEAARAPRRATA